MGNQQQSAESSEGASTSADANAPAAAPQRGFRPWMALVALAVVAVIIAVLALSSDPYEATAKVRVVPITSSQAEGAGTAAEQHAKELGGAEVRDLAVRDLGDRITAEELADQATVTATAADQITVVVRNDDPQLAADAANAMVRVFIATRDGASKQQVRETRRQLSRDYEALSKAEQNGPQGAQLRQSIRRLQSPSAASAGVFVEQSARAE